jgi:signal transduction histidine kinase
MKKITEKFRAIFGMREEASLRDTFKGELRYEADRLFYAFFVGFFAWIPYIRYDFALHQYPVFAFTTRTMFSVVSAVLILLKLTKRFKRRPDILFTVMVASLYLLTALVTATVGKNATTYMGGMSYVWILPAFAPLPLKIKYIMQFSAMTAFLLLGALAGLDFHDYSVLYSLSDLLIVFVLTMILSYIMNALRYGSWKQRIIISDLAEKAEAALRAKSEYLNTLSHEVRTPLSVISSYAQLAMRQFKQGAPDEMVMEGLDVISEEAHRIADLASNALAAKEPEIRPVDIGGIARQIVRLVSPMALYEGCRITVNITERIVASCNVGEITQAIWNMLDNAIKHSGSKAIEVDGNTNDESAYIIISDYGAGIPPDILPDVLKRGVSGSGGTGIGLAVSNEIAQNHGGRLIVDSEYGMGTRVTLVLPVYLPVYKRGAFH